MLFTILIFLTWCMFFLNMFITRCRHMLQSPVVCVNFLTKRFDYTFLHSGIFFITCVTHCDCYMYLSVVVRRPLTTYPLELLHEKYNVRCNPFYVRQVYGKRNPNCDICGFPITGGSQEERNKKTNQIYPPPPPKQKIVFLN